MRLKKYEKIAAGMVIVAAFLITNVMTVFAWPTTYRPTSATYINTDVITVGAHRDAQVSPEILGANVVATNQIGGASYNNLYFIKGEEVALNTATNNPMLEIFGSAYNDAPDPYYSNFFYNSYAAANGLTITADEVLNTAAGAPDAADFAPLTEYGTTTSLHRRPDMLLGINAGFGVSYGYFIANLPENNDTNPDNDYDPSLVDYQMYTSYQISDTLIDLAYEMYNVTIDTRKTTRYGDPMTIATDYEKYIKGIQAYVVKNINAGIVEKKTVAIVNPTPNEDGTFKAYDKTVSSGTADACRAAEYVANTTYNITSGMTKNADGTYHITAAQVEAADVIIIGGITNTPSNAEATFVDLLEDNYDIINIKPILSVLPETAYGMFMNSADNAIGFGYYNGYIYRSILDPTYATAYFYQNFYHISDLTKLQSAITYSFVNVGIVEAEDGINSSLTSYKENNLEAKIVAGMSYYDDNQSVFAGTELAGWEVDWSQGIGVDVNGENPDDIIYCSNEHLTQAQMEVNARYIYNYLIARGWTKNAICGMLGNMQEESTINPGRWQNGNAGNLGIGFGLAQWSPASKYFNWAVANGLDAYDINSQLGRILYEVEHNEEQWEPDAIMTFEQFTHCTNSAYNLALLFLEYYERPKVADPAEQYERGMHAEAWYEFFD